MGLADGRPSPSNFSASLPASRLQQQFHASAPSFAGTPSLLLRVQTKQRILLNISRKRGNDSLADILQKPTLGEPDISTKGAECGDVLVPGQGAVGSPSPSLQPGDSCRGHSSWKSQEQLRGDSKKMKMGARL